jgi:hypothetical protein
MSENIVPIIFGIVVGGGIVAVAAYHIGRYLRGSIKLSLPKTAFNPGDAIKGSFDLHVKKTIQGKRLIVNLIGTQITKTHESGKTDSRSNEIYRDEKLIEEAREYPASHRARHEFEIEAPDTGSAEFLNTPLGKAFFTALRLLGNRQTYLKWKIEVRLEAKGIDLATSRQVSINVPNM